VIRREKAWVLQSSICANKTQLSAAEESIGLEGRAFDQAHDGMSIRTSHRGEARKAEVNGVIA